jgi:hypothetical protein
MAKEKDQGDGKKRGGKKNEKIFINSCAKTNQDGKEVGIIGGDLGAVRAIATSPSVSPMIPHHLARLLFFGDT